MGNSKQLVRSVVAMSAAATMALACGGADSGGPTPPVPPRVYRAASMEDTVAVHIIGIDSAFYIVHAPRDGIGVLFVQEQTIEAAGQIIITDSATGQAVTQLTATRGVSETPLLATESNGFELHSGRTFIIEAVSTSLAVHDFRFCIAVLSNSPESRPDSIVPGSIYESESLTLRADVDRFHFTALSGHMYVAYLQPNATISPGRMRADIRDSAGTPRASLITARSPLALDDNSSGLFEAAASQRYTIEFGIDFATRTSAPFIPGSYRFEVKDVNPGVESADSVLIPGDTLASAIDYSGDVDRFAIQAPADDTLILSLQALTPAPDPGVAAEVLDQSGVVIRTLSAVADTALLDLVSPRFAVPGAGTYHVVVTGHSTFEHGAYRIAVLPISSAPEHVSGLISAGDTISGESIDLPNDIDDFRFTAAAGQYFNLFVEPTPSTGPDLQAAVYSPDGQFMAEATRGPGTGGLFGTSSGDFQAPVAGTYRIEIQTASHITSRYPYRLYLYRPDTLPEQTPAHLAVGDSIAGEREELPGDRDTYQVATGSADYLQLVLWKPDSVASTLSLVQEGTEVPIQFIGDSGRDSIGVSQAIAVTGGSQTFQVVPRGLAAPGESYGLEIQGIHVAPQGMAPQIAVGQVVDEALQPRGDIDRFTVFLQRNQILDLVIDSLPGLQLPEIRLQSPDSADVPVFSLNPPGGRVWRFEGTSTGTYALSVRGAHYVDNRIASISQHGAYRFHLDAVDTLPEHVPGLRAIGDSLVAERLESLTDVDRFTYTGAPGTEVIVWVHPDPFTGGSVNFRSELLYDTGDSVQALGQELGRAIGVTVMHPSGRLRIQVENEVAGLQSPDGWVGPYQLYVRPLDRSPEVAPAQLTLGDTVKGELINPIGDIDEFQFAGIAGQSIHLYASADAPALHAVRVTMVDLTSSNEILSIVLNGDRSVRLPSTGNYLVRVEGTDNSGARGPYILLLE